MPSYFRAPNPFWYLFYPNGNLQGGSFAVGTEITFYRDTQRNTKKPVYSDPGGNFPLPNPLRLSDLGRLGASVYFADDELYFLEIEYPDSIRETVEGFPNYGSGGGGSVTVGIDVENQLLNGQFRFIFADKFEPLPATEIDIAQAWTFKKNNISATDKIIFERFNLGDDTVDATPIYRCRYTCTGQGTSETQKDFIQYMADVRTFEQTLMGFSMDVFSDSARTIEVLFVQHFGTGGSPSADVIHPIGSFNLAAGVTDQITATFTPPPVSGKTRGTNGDDRIEFRIRMPLNSTSDIWFTSVYMNVGGKVFTYPRITKEKEDSQLLGSMIPTITDDDHGKAITANKSRTYNLSFPVIPGMPLPFLGTSVPTGYEEEWALSQGQTVSRSQNDFRYYRLFDFIGFAGGAPFDGWLATSNGDKVTITTTSSSSVTAPANQTPDPGFTITQYVSSNIVRDLFTVNRTKNSINDITIVNKLVGSAALISNSGGLAGLFSWLGGNTSRQQVVSAATKAGSAITSGQYFSIASTTTQYAVWYQVNGAGTAPTVPGATLIMVPISSTDTATQVSYKTMAYIGGYQIDEIQTVAASSVPSGAYFTINTHALQYYVWFKVGGVGTDPAPSGRVGLLVELGSGDTAAQVATKIVTVLNNEFYQIPDLRGAFIRGLDPSETIDFDFRLGNAIPGSTQWDNVIAHTHPFNKYLNLRPVEGTIDNAWNNETGTTTGQNLDVNNGGLLPPGQGGFETRPLNIAANYLIKL